RQVRLIELVVGELLFVVEVLVARYPVQVPAQLDRNFHLGRPELIGVGVDERVRGRWPISLSLVVVNPVCAVKADTLVRLPVCCRECEVIPDEVESGQNLQNTTARDWPDEL